MYEMGRRVEWRKQNYKGGGWPGVLADSYEGGSGVHPRIKVDIKRVHCIQVYL